MGPFTVLIGANASGKSNIRDAFRFLNGIGRDYPLVEILGEKYVGGIRIWNGIRGGMVTMPPVAREWLVRRRVDHPASAKSDETIQV